ncbi:plasma membrane calcium, partial [Podila minutissima]
MEEARKREGSGQRGVAVVLRDACEQQVDVDEIQVGDILMLLPGGDVPVDGIVLKSHGLACDEFGAVSEPEVKPTRDLHEGGHLISGTTVLSGSGSMLVTAVGSNLVANKARDSEDGRGPRERMMVWHAPKMCVALTMTLFVVSFSRYFIMSIPNGSLPPVRDILADLSKIAVQISGIILDSSADSLLMCGLCLAAYVFVQLRKRMSVTEVLFKEYRRMLAIGVALLCLAVSKNILETSMGTIFQKTPTGATT